MKKLAFILLAACATLTPLATPTTRAAILTSGGVSFQTGLPTPTLQITSPITLTITTGGAATLLVFDEWVISDAGITNVATNPGIQNVSFTLAATTGSTTLSGLRDNETFTAGNITANDGFLFFGAVNVTAGQTLTIQPGTYTFNAAVNFNPGSPVVFTGNAYLANDNGTALTAPTSVGVVPEPSAWAAVMAGAGLLGFATLRRRPVLG